LMSLFVCASCRHVDNTALAPGYWTAPVKLCTRCVTGKWHERFDRERYEPDVHGPIMPGRMRTLDPEWREKRAERAD
jgi:hypothetical protein